MSPHRWRLRALAASESAFGSFIPHYVKLYLNFHPCNTAYMTWKAPPGWYKLRKAVFAAKGRTCYWCSGRNGPATTIDHVIPAAISNDHSMANLVPACTKCNFGRGAAFGNRLRAGTLIQRPQASSRRW